MKLINAGFGRTGTTSLKGALETLGFTSAYHTTDLFESPQDLNFWNKAMEGKEVDWRAFFAPYEVADWPVALRYQDIIRAHPEAKVMLSVRDPEAWFESMSSTLNQVLRLDLPNPQVGRVKQFLEAHMIGSLFEGSLNDKASMIDVFERHVEAVKAFVGAELLVYNVKAGWEPLCSFLEVAVPNEPFPRLNQRGSLREMIVEKSGGAQTQRTTT